MFDFSKIFSFSVDIFASSDIGGVNDEAEDPHDRGAVHGSGCVRGRGHAHGGPYKRCSAWPGEN